MMDLHQILIAIVMMAPATRLWLKSIKETRSDD